MAGLQVKTYLDQSPRGLVRVLFFAAGEDHDRYLDEIAGRILERYHHVAVYYSEDPADITDEVLSEMRLAVCPVTMAFLSEECEARKQLFDRILERHIALLPIGMERGIEKTFNLICGELQFLDAVTQDATALGFEHKLVNFLNDILLDEHVSAQIRDAFDAYIFLSYRKKDRRSANEIMRLIHKNDFMRDVAIWYDEYLVPGENFSEAISDALLKSGLMALVVTPNLVNEDNYVKDTEYPMARRAEKPVLPILAEETDEKALRAGFEGIVTPIGTDHPEEISHALLTLYDKEWSRGNDDPDHLCFIALAYLYGIDVETDTERAVSLLEDASRGGSIAASKKLAQMYLQGQFVEADYHKAADLLDRIVAQLKEAGDPADRDGYLERIDYLREQEEILERCQEFDRAMHLSADTYRLQQEMDERFPDPWNELVRAGIIRDICRAALQKDPPPGGIGDYLEEICSIYYDYFGEYGYGADWDILPLLALMTKASGEDEFAIGIREDGLAQMYFESVQEQQDSGAAGAEENLLALSYSYVCMMTDFCEYALAHFDEMDERIRAHRMRIIEDADRTIKASAILLIKKGHTDRGISAGQRYFDSFGRYYLRMGEYDKAKQMFEIAFGQLHERYDEPDNILRQCGNARNLILLGGAAGDAESLKLGHYTLTELLERLYRATGAAEFKRQLDENEEQIRAKGL